MQTYLEETLKFIESEEMRAYLRKVAPEWLGREQWGRHTCAEIVSSAPASLELKIPVLELIAEQTQAGEYDFENPAKFAKQSRLAFDEQDNNPPGTIFWLEDFYYSEESGDFFFTGFDAAIRFIKEQLADNEDPDIHEYQSYSICKLIPGEKGKMIEYCHWILNFSGEIWYFDYLDGEPEDWEDLFDWIGGSLNLPVPFTPGDVILADCRPFAKERRVLILEIGDNSDCCAVQCLYPLPKGKLNMCAFKHNSFLHHLENSHISGLYRAARWTGELTEQEAPLAIIGKVVKANPALGGDIWEYIWQNKKDDGVTWEQLQTAFGL